MLKLMCCRFWQSYLRDVPYNGTRFVFAGVLAVLFGLILLNVNHKKCAPDLSPSHVFFRSSLSPRFSCADLLLVCVPSVHRHAAVRKPAGDTCQWQVKTLLSINGD